MKVSLKAVVLSDEIKAPFKEGDKEKRYIYVNQKGDKENFKILVPKDFKCEIGKTIEAEVTMISWSMGNSKGISLKIE